MSSQQETQDQNTQNNTQNASGSLQQNQVASTNPDDSNNREIPVSNQVNNPEQQQSIQNANGSNSNMNNNNDNQEENQFININEIKSSNLGFINPEYYDEFNRPKYEEIVKYENSIREEMEKNTPLVSDMLDIEVLRAEYKESIYEKAIDEFVKKINKWRTVRRDGNCFYRSFLFRLFEEFIQRRDPNLHKNLTKLVEDAKDLCNENGYSWLVLEDFYNAFLSEWKFIQELDKEQSLNYLKLLFNDKERCNYMIVFIRMCIAAYIKQNRFLYENFIEEDIDSFCLREVEAIDHECDHIQINAITSYFNIGVVIENLNQNSVESMSFSNNPNDPIFIHMFFRPGHYDILYPKSI